MGTARLWLDRFPQPCAKDLEMSPLPGGGGSFLPFPPLRDKGPAEPSLVTATSWVAGATSRRDLDVAALGRGTSRNKG